MEATIASAAARPASKALALPRVVHLTTSYPRHPEDFAGRFVADVVEGLERHGVDVSVLAPAGDVGVHLHHPTYRDFGLAYGGGIVHNVKRRPWLAPLLLVAMVRAVRRTAGRRDLVHAHWLAAGAVCALARRPFVLTLHGSGTAGRFADLALAQRFPRLFRAIVRRARVVICVSEALGAAARRCGARDVRVIPNGVRIPPAVEAEAEPLEVLFAGRLSPEKGIEELVAATAGMNLVVAGDGPLRHVVPDALGFVAHAELERLYARAAVVVLPSYREGLPLCVIEAMAHGRPVVASAVGGIPELVEDGVTGFLVEPGDVEGLRAALERLLADPELRRRMGRAGRAKVAERCSIESVTEATLDAYRQGEPLALPAGRAQTITPSLQNGASRPALP
ncbi:MAG TPA: glycosyltransferase family 4 protein [Gaiellaceae bacterium]